MSKIWPYIVAFLSGALLVALYALNVIKPAIIADSYIEKLEQNVKKLKQSGENNTQDITRSISIESEPKKKRKFLGIFNRRKA